MLRRNKYLDSMRGVASLLVILGHCFQASYVDYPSLFLYQFIYSFHVPLFAFVSGFVYAKQTVFVSYIWNRFRRLFIPYLIWMTVIALLLGDALIRIDPIQFFMRGVLLPQTPWFLYILFFASLLFFLVIYYGNSVLLYIFIVITFGANMYSRLNVSSVTFETAARIAHYSLILLLGYTSADYLRKQKVLPYERTVCLITILFLFVYFIIPFHIRKDPLMYPFEVVAALSGIYIVFFIVKRLSLILNFAFMEWLGKHALEIYVLHYIFLQYIPYANSSIFIFLSSFIGVTIGTVLLVVSIGKIQNIFPSLHVGIKYIFGRE